MADTDNIEESEEWRKERHERLLDPKGWLTLAGSLSSEVDEENLDLNDTKVIFFSYCP